MLLSYQTFSGEIKQIAPNSLLVGTYCVSSEMPASVNAESIDASDTSAIFEARRNSIAAKGPTTGIRRRSVRWKTDLVIILERWWTGILRSGFGYRSLPSSLGACYGFFWTKCQRSYENFPRNSVCRPLGPVFQLVQYLMSSFTAL